MFALRLFGSLSLIQLPPPPSVGISRCYDNKIAADLSAIALCIMKHTAKVYEFMDHISHIIICICTDMWYCLMVLVGKRFCFSLCVCVCSTSSYVHKFEIRCCYSSFFFFSASSSFYFSSHTYTVLLKHDAFIHFSLRARMHGMHAMGV